MSWVDPMGLRRQVSTGGLRNETPLTAAQKAEALDYAKSLGMPEDMIVFSESMNTSYGEVFDVLYIGTDVLTATGVKLSANSRVSPRGAIAHELVGHRAANIAGKTQSEIYMEEAQASIRAARFAPRLTDVERNILICDGLTRLHREGVKIKDVKHDLWIRE